MIPTHAHIHIFLPVYNRRDLTSRFLNCLRNQTRQDYHLLLIDDGSTDGTEDLVRHEIPDATVLKGKGRWWWAGALQQGLAWAKKSRLADSDVLVIMNNDTAFEPDFLATGVRLLQATKRTVISAQCYGQQSERLVDVGVRVDWARFEIAAPPAESEIHCLSTRGMFIRYGDMKTIGNFHPLVLPHYLSDFEYSYRGWKKGFTLATYPALKLWVDEEATGIHRSYPKSTIECFRRQFSPRSAANLPSWLVFIWLACPGRWMLMNWFRVTLRSMKELLVCVRGTSAIGRFLIRRWRRE